MMIMRRARTAYLLMKPLLMGLVCVGGGLGGCSSREAVLPHARRSAAATDPLPVEVVYVHQVRFPGETLAMISNWYTGSAENWIQILDLNRRLSPNRLQIGDEVRIPGSLMRVQERLTEAYVRAFIRQVKPRHAPPPRLSSQPAYSPEPAPGELLIENDETRPANNSPEVVVPPSASPVPEETPEEDALRDEFIREMLRRSQPSPTS